MLPPNIGVYYSPPKLQSIPVGTGRQASSAGTGRFCTVPERREVTAKIDWVVKS